MGQLQKELEVFRLKALNIISTGACVSGEKSAFSPDKVLKLPQELQFTLRTGEAVVEVGFKGITHEGYNFELSFLTDEELAKIADWILEKYS